MRVATPLDGLTIIAMTKLLFVRAVALATFLTLLSVSLMAAEYYVVIGTFANEANAKRFTSHVSQVLDNVSYSFNEKNKMYFVHVLKTSRKDEARNWSLYLRHEIGFHDAWVLAYPETESGVMLAGNSARRHEPRYVQEMAGSSEDLQQVYATARASAEAPGYALAANKPVTAEWSVHGNVAFITGIDASTNIKDNPLLASSPVFTFKVETPDGRPLSSEVMLVNFEKVKKIAGFVPGEHVAIKPSKKNQVVTFVCDVLGYAMETRMFKMDNLSRGRDIVEKKNGIWEVTFKLRKLKVDEVAFMNKTTFYPDAAVLEPSSDVEMNDLLAMMQSNPGYKIVLHGHCNPAARRAIKLPANQDYFNLDRAQSKTGSDKLLTRLRAETIRNFLVDRGIDKRRIGIVGWGSSDLLVNSTAEDAYINDRIELELVAE